MWTLFVVLLYAFKVTDCLDNGLALTPPMGWMSWLRYRCIIDCDTYPNDCLTEDLILRTAEAMKKDGWLKAGYEYVIVDDCWFANERNNATEKLESDPKRFPHVSITMSRNRCVRVASRL